MQHMSARFQNMGRSLSERDALSPRASETHSYGSFLLSLGGLRSSLRRYASYQVNNDSNVVTFCVYVKRTSNFPLNV